MTRASASTTYRADNRSVAVVRFFSKPHRVAPRLPPPRRSTAAPPTCPGCSALPPARAELATRRAPLTARQKRQTRAQMHKPAETTHSSIAPCCHRSDASPATVDTRRSSCGTCGNWGRASTPLIATLTSAGVTHTSTQVTCSTSPRHLALHRSRRSSRILGSFLHRYILQWRWKQACVCWRCLPPPFARSRAG